MVQRLRAIELLLRTQNELLTRMLAELEQTRRCAEERARSTVCFLRLLSPITPNRTTH
jgi:hypothetical protein